MVLYTLTPVHSGERTIKDLQAGEIAQGPYPQRTHTVDDINPALP